MQQMLNNSYGQITSTQQEYHTVRVNGEPGARSFALPPNSDAVLIDNTASMIWLVQTDGAGYKTLTPYDISPHEDPTSDTNIKQLEDRISKLEEKFSSGKFYNANTKPYSSNTRSRKFEQCDATSSSSNDER